MNEQATRVCVTGAAGNLGGFTSRHLVEHTDYRLHLMTHRKPLNAELKRHSRVTVFRCDLDVKETLVEILTGVDVVVHYAGVLFQSNPESFLPTTNVEYFRNLLEVARQQGVRKVILVSFPHVEGYTSPASPSTDRRDRMAVSVHASTRLEEERLLFAHFPDSVVLRVGMVYGRGVLMPDVARWFARRSLLGVWRPPTGIHLISKYDFLESVRVACTNPRATGTYNIGDDGVQTLQEYLDFACEQWNCPRPWRMPLWMIYLAASCFELVSRVFGTQSPLTRDFIDIGRISYYGDTRRMKEDLIAELKYPTMKEGADTF